MYERRGYVSWADDTGEAMAARPTGLDANNVESTADIWGQNALAVRRAS